MHQNGYRRVIYKKRYFLVHQRPIIPYVMTWDRMVTICHRNYVRQLRLPANIESYIQARVLKRTLESVSRESRRNVYGDAGRLEKALEKMLQDGIPAAGDC